MSLGRPMDDIAWRFCITRVSLPDIAMPASDTMKSALPSAASIMAIVPPSLSPNIPTLLKRLRNNGKADAASWRKSAVVN